ncbi:hypothetical protein FRB96_009377 [Tulasnella sp. 330]|nr:hypothetical protein FRB96_009377 [Tulasnella sp. 330]KAG8884696.1 hypothetical protein FRB97_003480 [Tulasnella sp. 331]KAG8889670.1 hypothetical protein FRB98_003233 [Tulasnella sp. 332]
MASPYPHYAWAGGHFLLLAASLRYLLAWITFKSVAYAFWYKLAFSGALASYAIVVYKSLGTPQPNMAYLRKATADENFQYFVLALYWFFSKPMALALVPYATFSLFHVLTFTRTNLIPRVLPATPAAGQSDRTAQHPIAKTLHAWVKANYDPAMRSVAWAELLILARVILGAVIGIIPYLNRLPIRNSLLAPLLFAHFLRLRYFHSAFTRQVIQSSDAIITKNASAPGTNPSIKKAIDVGRTLIVRWCSTSMVPQANGAAGAAPAHAAPTAGARR